METSAEARLATEPTQTQAFEEKLRDLERRLAEVEDRTPEDRVSIIVFSGDLDRVLAAFVIASGAAAMDQQVSIFFTFWGLGVLKKDSQLSGKTLFQKMMAAMSPGSSKDLPVSKMNYFGGGSEDASLDDEGKERQFTRRNDVSRTGTRGANDRLRHVRRGDGDRGIGTRRRSGVRRGGIVSCGFTEVTDEPLHLKHAS